MLSVATACATLALLAAGALVTSTGSGLAVPDWPLSFGSLLPPMVGAVLYEHGHRLLGFVVGLLTVTLAASIFLSGAARGLKLLAAAALLTVVLQGVLGGITVLYELPLAVSVAHACVGQVFFVLTVTIAVATGRGWTEPRLRGSGSDPRGLAALAAVSAAAVFVQLVLGAVVRHTGAGLAIPDFPLAFGRLLPPLGAPEIAIHFAHRVGAVALGAVLGGTVVWALRYHAGEPQLLRPALLAAGLFVAQVFIGGTIIWTHAAVAATTAHLVVGALLLATSVALAVRAAGEARLGAGSRAGLGGSREAAR